jgi:salicylate 1-O-methyltransferase
LTQGSIEEEKLATFNLPLYAPSTEELKQIIDNEDSFKLKHIETFKLPWDANYRATGDSRNQETREEYLGMYMRAIFEPVLASHFGESIMNDLFLRHGKKASEYMRSGKGTINSVVISLVKESKQ